jgi:hypothetical protein
MLISLDASLEMNCAGGMIGEPGETPLRQTALGFRACWNYGIVIWSGIVLDAGHSSPCELLLLGGAEGGESQGGRVPLQGIIDK